MRCEAPLPIPRAIEATHEGKYGLKRLPFTDPQTGDRAYVSTINGYTGPELKLEFPNEAGGYDESYWTTEGEHISGNEPPTDNTFSEPQWTASPPRR